MSMSISIIIPTYNAEAYLLELLEMLKSQTISFELIIIDSSSTDSSLAIAQKYADKIISIPKAEFDHGGTRTKAGREASGDILVFLTQDALPYNSESIEHIVKIFDNPQIGASYGKQLAYKDTNQFGKHLREFNYGKESYIRELKDKNQFGIKTAFLSDSFASYRREALEKIDWIKDGLIVGEDTYAGAKLLLNGYSIAYIANAKVYHSHSYTIIQEFKRYFDIGVFHQREKWILKEFGKAEGEGGKYIKSEMKYLILNNLYSLIPQFFIRNGMKYLGYKLGQKYRLIPLKLIKKLSMHSFWWNST
ncbi:MAG: glycosyltransferase family 2 protein [Sulfurovum sp.]|nr:glycosyltransferase family 2 protein [Sulfurovaceae bacterium]